MNLLKQAVEVKAARESADGQVEQQGALFPALRAHDESSRKETEEELKREVVFLLG